MSIAKLFSGKLLGKNEFLNYFTIGINLYEPIVQYSCDRSDLKNGGDTLLKWWANMN